MKELKLTDRYNKMIWSKIDKTWELEVKLPDSYPEFTAEIETSNIKKYNVTCFRNGWMEFTDWTNTLKEAKQTAEVFIKMQILNVAKHKATPNLKDIKDVE